MSINLSNYVTSTSTSTSSLGGQLDVQSIVEQLIYVKQQPIRDLETFQTFYTAKKTAFQELNTHVSAVESALYAIKSAGFSSYSAASSDEDLLTVSASSTAGAGNYSITVGQLARAQSNTSTGYGSSTDAVLAEGTAFRVTQGGETKTIAITGQTRSLNGLKNAINSAGLDVTATLLYDGSKYKLQVTADSTGTENAFTIDDTSGGAVGTSMSTPKLTALDAEIYVNSPVAAENKITRSGNSITDVIPGLTLNLKKADLTGAVDVTVTSDTSSLREKIETFVTEFNSTVAYLNTQFAYNEEKSAAGVLSGETAARTVQMDLLSMVSARVQGLGAGDSYKSLAEIGLTIDQNGQLAINDQKLDRALGDHLDAVKRIFLDVGNSTHSDVGYVGHTDATQAGTYAVSVSRLAERATVQGGAEVPGGGIAQDETLTITYGGAAYSVALTSGMTLNQVVNAINTELGDSNVPVFAAASGNTLQISSEAYGSKQTVRVVSNVAAGSNGTGIGTTARSDTGVNVAGTINGQAASGEGDILTSTAGDSNGLMVLVNTTTLGDKGEVTLTFGVGEQLRQKMFDASLPYEGLIARNISAMDDQLENISTRISDINRQLAKEQEILIQQFTKANEALAELEYLQSTLSNSITGSK